MRGKKGFVLGLVLALSLTLISGCTSAKPLPESMDEEVTGEAGQAIVAMLAEEDYQGVVDSFRADMKDAYSVTPDAVKDIMDQALAEAGAFVSVDKTLVIGGQSDDFDEDYASVIVYAEHESQDVIYELSFDTDLALLGLGVKQK